MNTTGAAEFFDAAQRAFTRARERTGLREHDLAIAGRAVRVRFAGATLEPFVLPPLAHLETARAPREPALTIELFDTRSTGVALPPLPWTRDALGVQGAVADEHSGIRATLTNTADVVHLFDPSRRAGLCWVADPDEVAWWEWSAPLRTILHWWTVPTSLLPLHAGAVGRDGRGVLVVGASGAGKSTTTLACLEAGLDFAGDDYVLVDVESATAHTLYNTGKLEPHNLARFPDLATAVTNADRLHEEKALVSVHDHRPERLATALALEAIVLPHVVGTPASRLVTTSPAAALRMLAPTTTMHLPGSHREVFTKLNHLVRRLPCHRLDAGTDLHELARVVGSVVGDGGTTRVESLLPDAGSSA